MRSVLILRISVESLPENQFQHCSLLSYLWLQDDWKIKISIETDDRQDLKEAKKEILNLIGYVKINLKIPI